MIQHFLLLDAKTMDETRLPMLDWDIHSLISKLLLYFPLYMMFVDKMIVMYDYKKGGVLSSSCGEV